MKTFSLDNSWNYFEELLALKLPVAESWVKFIDFHQQLKDKHYWNELLHLKIVDEQLEVKNWLESIVEKSPIPNDVRALWLGITTFEDKLLQKDIYAIYLQGSASYDAEEIDWASYPIYEPEGAYVALKNLNSIAEIIKDDKLDYKFLITLLPLAYCSFVFDDIFQSKIDKEKFAFYKSKLYITTGYDSGAFQNLGTLKK
jgi:hypothetical protein